MTCYNSELPIGPPGPTGPIGPQGPSGTSENVESGIWIPTIINEINCDVQFLGIEGYYSRIENIVTCSIGCTIIFDAEQNQISFELTPPVPSNFSGINVNGSVSTNNVFSMSLCNIISNNLDNIKIEIEGTPGTAMQNGFVIQYIVV